MRFKICNFIFFLGMKIRSAFEVRAALTLIVSHNLNFPIIFVVVRFQYLEIQGVIALRASRRVLALLKFYFYYFQSNICPH